MLTTAKYEEVRSRMRPGDVLAFSSKGNWLSDLIADATRGEVSHVGIVVLGQVAGGDSVMMVDSTSIGGRVGVMATRVSRRVEMAEEDGGSLWWLPLSDEARDRLEDENGELEEALVEWVWSQVGKKYDYRQAIAAGLDTFDRLGGWTHTEECFRRLFCSELVAAALEVGQVVAPLNASEKTPIDVCRWRLYRPSYFQLCGPREEILEWNTRVAR